MKAGFSGAGGTGKSAVLEALNLPIPVLPSVARSVYERRGIKESDQLTMNPIQLWDLQKDIFNTRVAAEEKMDGSFISDRTLVDHMAYCLIRANAGMPADEYKTYEDKMLFSMSGYSLVVYFPFDPKAYKINDGFRQADVPYQVAVDIMIYGLLQKHRINFIVAPHWSYPIVERADEIRKRIVRIMGR